MRYYVAVLLILSVFGVPWFIESFPDAARSIAETAKSAGDQIAAVILSRRPVTVDQLKNDYNSANLPGKQKVRILIVPGHEPGYGGAEYGRLKERDLTVDVSEELSSFLKKNPRLEVFTTRDKRGWTPEFAYYFDANWDQIIEWQQASRAETARLKEIGHFSDIAPAVHHNKARNDVAYRLYGINKWANENEIDIVVHLHFNDYPGHGSVGGDYSGFSIYVPQQQFLNSTSTRAVAETVYSRMAKYNPVSDLPGESTGIIEEQELIAIGTHNTLDAASMLIEYSYIYEPHLVDPSVRPLFLKELAYETYLGLMDFFDPMNAALEAHDFDTLTLPYAWAKDMDGEGDSASDVFAMQTAFVFEGIYPPPGFGRNECPRSGMLGPCTKAALRLFQDKYGITGEKGFAGPKTTDTLNRIYSSKPN